jgi:hypothetical protein
MAERVTQTVELAETELIDAGYQTLDAPYLGKMALTQKDMIQCHAGGATIAIDGAKDNLFLALEGSKVD